VIAKCRLAWFAARVAFSDDQSRRDSPTAVVKFAWHRRCKSTRAQPLSQRPSIMFPTISLPSLSRVTGGVCNCGASHADQLKNGNGGIVPKL